MGKVIRSLVLVAGLCAILGGLAFLPAQYVPPTPGATTLLAQGSLSSAQVLALNGTPVTVIAAPGTGAVVIVEAFVSQLVYGGTAYVGSGTITLVTDQGNSITNGTGCVAAFLTATSNNFCYPTLASTTANASVNWVTRAIQLKMGTAQDTTGNGTISYWITYHIQPGF